MSGTARVIDCDGICHRAVVCLVSSTWDQGAVTTPSPLLGLGGVTMVCWAKLL